MLVEKIFTRGLLITLDFSPQQDSHFGSRGLSAVFYPKHESLLAQSRDVEAFSIVSSFNRDDDGAVRGWVVIAMRCTRMVPGEVSQRFGPKARAVLKMTCVVALIDVETLRSETMPHLNLQTEFEFTLPKGYLDEQGKLHTKGVMRLAKAADEIYASDPADVRSNPAYLTIIILSRVIVRLGHLDMVNTHVIENLFSEDFAYLQDFYRQINGKSEQAPAAKSESDKPAAKETPGK